MDDWYITVKELDTMKKLGYSVYVVDVRANEKYRKLHINGAVNMVPDDNYDLSPEHERIIKERIDAGYTVVLYCSSGITAMKCVRRMRKRRIITYDLYGGIKEYIRVVYKSNEKNN